MLETTRLRWLVEQTVGGDGRHGLFLNHSFPDRLGILTCPPESVWGTGTMRNSLEAFLGSMGSMTSPETARITL